MAKKTKKNSSVNSQPNKWKKRLSSTVHKLNTTEFNFFCLVFTRSDKKSNPYGLYRYYY
jgi:hypothetical protein